MFKKVSTLLLVAVFAISAISFAGVKRGEKTKKIASESVVMSSEVAAPSVKMAKSAPVVVKVTAGPAEGIEIGNTDYDYGWNSGSSRGAASFNNGAQVHMGFNERDLDAGAAPLNRRAYKYAFWDAANPGALVLAYPRPKATGATGFGGVDVIPAGAGAGIGVMAYHTPNFFAIDGSPGAGSFTESAVASSIPQSGGLDPEITATKDGNTLWYYETKNRTDVLVAKSTDFGGTWTGVDTLFSHYANASGKFVAPGALDVPVITAPNGDLYWVGTIEGHGSVAPLGTTAADSADRIGYFKSTNGGTSWTWTDLGKDGDKLVVSAGDTVYVLFENFSGVDAVVDASNNLHVVANGYCQKLINDSTASNRFYTIYWKSGQGWKIISDKAAGAYAEYDSSYYNYNGNAIGNAYPTIAAGGNSIFAAWSQAIFNGGKMDTTGGFVQYEMWYSYSNNNGTSWAAPVKVANSVGALFSTAAEQLGITGATATAAVVYYADTARGSVVFDGMPSVQIPVMFRTISFSTATSVGDEQLTPGTFELSQNYPNPFNPTTNIRYAVGKASNVSLKVYNMLGQEVATVVNQFQNAGSYSVNFDASSLASGMYLYKIQSGNFSDVKKMMLLK